MKKIVMFAIILAPCLEVGAQRGEIDKPNSVTSSSQKNIVVEDSLSKQEIAIRELRQENENLKKEVRKIKDALPLRNRNFVISRRGSKQVAVE